MHTALHANTVLVLSGERLTVGCHFSSRRRLRTFGEKWVEELPKIAILMG